MEQKKYAATAFVSCSLRHEDKPFVNYIEKILKAYNIKPFGTVGKYSASPENPAVLMKKNIPFADFVVICATKRYLQKDIHTGQVSFGLSEMIHVETGIAYAHDKPVVVFVREGSSTGNFIPNITQFITLDGTREDFLIKKQLIFSLLNNAYLITKGVKDELQKNKALKIAGQFAVGGLAIYGGVKLLEQIFRSK